MKQALITIDFINELTNKDGKLSHSVPFIESHQTLQHANHVLKWARQNQILIMHVKVGFSENYIECPSQSPIFGQAKEKKALILGTWGTEFNQQLVIQAADKVIIKHRISAFYNTDLEAVLSAQAIEHVIICGVATNMAVELTSREAHDRDYQVTVIGDACATMTDVIHQSALENIKRIGKVKMHQDFPVN